ncbi:MAG: hypothetical protein H0W02_16215 [Ktedonobacteraceae bacterium]|nr:hypothetical protein [Ktedonobacteraceae bacterium]
MARPRQHPFKSLIAIAMTLAIILGFGWVSALHTLAATQKPQTNSCQLQNGIKHVFYIQFDNTHLMRDNPNVPSDLEQMPHLLNFIKNNGTMLSNNHTPLIAHTATDILTSFTGMYPDRHGVPISNSYRYYNPDGTTNPGVSFAYWTAPIFDPSNPPAQTDKSYNMITSGGKNTPAPWVPYTRAGCNFGGVATANMVLENTAIDIPTVFGPNSPQEQEVKSNPTQAFSDFVGVGVHCAQGNALCSSANTGVTDTLPDEPGGYNGYTGLFGHKYVAPQIAPNGLTDLNGNPIAGFPGFDGMTPAVSLAYVAAMQEHNVPVTYAYISDAHDPHTDGSSYGPGQSGYVAALKLYDDAFAKFFTRLAKDGITKNNSLFVFTADEGDHFVGSSPSPANCNGVTVPCSYSKVGEVNTNMAGLLATEQGVTTPFKVHSDSAPNVYIQGQPARTDPTARNFERASGKLTAANPYTNKTEKITNYMADPVEMNLLHMLTVDPARTPTFTLFAKPDYYLYAGAPNCSAPCVTINSGFAWNHGDVSPDINTTWLGLVGPGVRHQGVNGSVWADHTDIRPTMMELLGLKDDYRHDGRVLLEVLKDSALPSVVRHNRALLTTLGQILKQIDAPVGTLGLITLQASTLALKSGNSGNDSTYTQIENALQVINAQRDTIANGILAILETAEFGSFNTSSHVAVSNTQGNRLVTQGHDVLTHGRSLLHKH